MKKDDQRIRLTKRLLKENLIELLGKKDIGKISVTELCSRSDINRSTFYQHYNTPKDVLLDIEREFSEKALTALKGMTDSGSFEERLTSVCSFIHENAGLQTIILKNTSDEEVAQIFSNNGFIIWDTSTYFRKSRDVDETSRRLTSVFVNYGIFHVIREWIVNDIPKTPQEIAKIICDVAIRQNASE